MPNNFDTMSKKELREYRRQQTCLKKYGVLNPSQISNVRLKRKEQMPQILSKMKSTCIEKYGVDNIMKCDTGVSRLKETVLKDSLHYVKVQNAVQRTNMLKYGVKTTLLEPNTVSKIKDTNVKKYGVENPMLNCDVKRHHKEIMNSEVYRESYKEGMLTCYGVESPLQDKNILEKKNQTCLKNNGWISPFEKEEIRIKAVITKEENPVCITSPERQIIDFVSKEFPALKINVHNRREIYPLEIDIFLPELNFGIEVNGSYWHKDCPENYHLNKYMRAKEKDITILMLHVESLYSKETLNIVKKVLETQINIMNREAI